MRILLTGGAGFLGARLARALLRQGSLDGREITELAIVDTAVPPADLRADHRVRVHTGPLLAQTSVFSAGFDGVFHLASAVSGECELDFELGLRSNLDSTRMLLEGLRHSGKAPKLVFASSIGVYGTDGHRPLPDPVSEDTVPAPTTSYGTHKLMCEYLIADYTRKGFIDGRSARLMTVTVRPGRPNGAATSFLSAIIREPLAGIETLCPVEADFRHAFSSPDRTIEGLIAVYQAARETLGGRLALNLPAVNLSIAEILDALESVAGADVRARVRFVRDERIAGIVSGWARGASADRAAALGLRPDASFAAIIDQYIHDCRTRPGYPEGALAGLAGGTGLAR